MTTRTSAQAKLEIFCSFCGKSNEQVKSMIAGPLSGEIRIYICDKCVDTCNRILSGKIPPLTQNGPRHRLYRKWAIRLKALG